MKSTIKCRKGTKLVCIHYKDRPIVTVDEVTWDDEIWVIDNKGNSWWGPLSWFKKVKK